MHCLACDAFLTKVEETSRKYKSNGVFVDLCNNCFDHISDQVATVTRYDSEDGELDDFPEK